MIQAVTIQHKTLSDNAHTAPTLLTVSMSSNLSLKNQNLRFHW